MATILMVLTSQARFGNTDKPTGFWLEELAAPYYVMLAAGHELVLASPRGGLPPLDPVSREPDNMKPAGERLLQDQQAMQQLVQTTPLADIDTDAFDAVFYPGGHGPLWDLVDNPYSLNLIEQMAAAGKPIGSICHGPAVLLNALDQHGRPLIAGRRVTCFSNSEETEIGLAQDVPFLLADALRHAGAEHVAGENWQDFSVTDGLLVTGQNPASAESTAKRLLELVG